MSARGFSCAFALVVAFALGSTLDYAEVSSLAGKEPTPGRAQPGSLRTEFWADIGVIPGQESPSSSGPDEGARTLVDEAAGAIVAEAAWVWSGSLYGFDFDWSPQDNARGIAERFSMKPRASIEKGDPRFVPEATRREGDRLYCYVSYAPDPAQASLLASYLKAPWKAAQGSGGGDYFKGLEGKLAACEEAARQAVRELLRSYEPNKPRRVKGRLVFQEPPILGVVEGHYLAKARFRVEVTEVLGYLVY